MTSPSSPERELHDFLLNKASDEGRLLEIGWHACKDVFTPQQEGDLRLAYYAGAQHLFASIMGFLDNDKEPSVQDLLRMDKLYHELKTIVPELLQRGFTKKKAS